VGGNRSRQPRQRRRRGGTTPQGTGTPKSSSFYPEGWVSFEQVVAQNPPLDTPVEPEIFVVEEKPAIQSKAAHSADNRPVIPPPSSQACHESGAPGLKIRSDLLVGNVSEKVTDHIIPKEEPAVIPTRPRITLRTDLFAVKEEKIQEIKEENPILKSKLLAGRRNLMDSISHLSRQESGPSKLVVLNPVTEVLPEETKPTLPTGSCFCCPTFECRKQLENIGRPTINPSSRTFSSRLNCDFVVETQPPVNQRSLYQAASPFSNVDPVLETGSAMLQSVPVPHLRHLDSGFGSSDSSELFLSSLNSGQSSSGAALENVLSKAYSSENSVASLPMSAPLMSSSEQFQMPSASLPILDIATPFAEPPASYLDSIFESESDSADIEQILNISRPTTPEPISQLDQAIASISCEKLRMEQNPVAKQADRHIAATGSIGFMELDQAIASIAGLGDSCETEERVLPPAAAAPSMLVNPAGTVAVPLLPLTEITESAAGELPLPDTIDDALCLNTVNREAFSEKVQNVVSSIVEDYTSGRLLDAASSESLLSNIPLVDSSPEAASSSHAVSGAVNTGTFEVTKSPAELETACEEVSQDLSSGQRLSTERSVFEIDEEPVLISSPFSDSSRENTLSRINSTKEIDYLSLKPVDNDTVSVSLCNKIPSEQLEEVVNVTATSTGTTLSSDDTTKDNSPSDSVDMSNLEKMTEENVSGNVELLLKEPHSSVPVSEASFDKPPAMEKKLCPEQEQGIQTRQLSCEDEVSVSDQTDELLQAGNSLLAGSDTSVTVLAQKPNTLFTDTDISDISQLQTELEHRVNSQTLSIHITDAAREDHSDRTNLALLCQGENKFPDLSTLSADVANPPFIGEANSQLGNVQTEENASQLNSAELLAPARAELLGEEEERKDEQSKLEELGETTLRQAQEDVPVTDANSYIPTAVSEDNERNTGTKIVTELENAAALTATAPGEKINLI
jgi:hypothetical protein